MLYLNLILFVQTVCESLPISSSGHVALATAMYQKYFWSDYAFNAIPVLLFEPWFHSLHAITALILALYFFREWFFLLANFARLWRMILKLIFLVGIADVVTCGWYVVFHFYPVAIPLGLGFFITGLLLASLYFVAHAHGRKALNVRDALILGVVQGLSLLPGISRFAATFVVSRWLGYSNRRAFELTWMMQWPLIAAASALGFYQLYELQVLGQFYSVWMMGVCLVVGIGGYYALRFAHWCAINNRMWWFAFYMIVPLILSCTCMVQ